ncbi:MAG: phage portal protein [Alphaproteobacteria bacterium]|nr:phage portal protein [Alphaproteobacteria bacterium]
MRWSNLVAPLRRRAQSNVATTPAPQQVKTSAAGPVIAWSGVGQPRWTPRRYDTLADEGFKKNVIAYRCVMQIANASAAVPWLLYDEGGQELDQHPLLNLLQHPNPLQDGVSFMESVYANLQISGNAYIEAVMPRDDERPVELYVLRPDRMKVVPGPTGLPQGYQYNVNGKLTSWRADPITGASPILHLKTFHPLDDWYGLAPMEAALLSIDQHNAAGSWNQALLNQGARPSGALVYAPKDGSPTLTDEQLLRLREEMGQLYQGDRNAGRPLILEGGLEWREMSLSPKDMDWLSGRNNAARDIALAFGIPAQMVGIADSQTYANMAEARMAFYEETIIPLVTRVIAGFDHWLTPMYGRNLQLDFDMDDISALTPRRDALWNKAQAAGFLTRNEKRAVAGYGPVPGGDAEDEGSDSDDPDPAIVDADDDTLTFSPDFLKCGAPKYSPDQPRVPAGNSDGGQWTSGGGDGGQDSAVTEKPAQATGDNPAASPDHSDSGQEVNTGHGNTIDDPPIEPVYPIETILSALTAGSALKAAISVVRGLVCQETGDWRRNFKGRQGHRRLSGRTTRSCFLQ